MADAYTAVPYEPKTLTADVGDTFVCVSSMARTGNQMFALDARSGAILWQFAEVALRGRQTRVADLLQPAFAQQ